MDFRVVGSRHALRLWQVWGGRGLLFTPVVFLLIFFIYPLGRIFDYSLRPEGWIDLSGFVQIISSAYYRETVFFTLWQALLSTGLTLALALPSAYLFAKYRWRGKQTLLSLASLPFVLPTVVVASAFDALLSERGAFNDLLMGLLHLPEAPIQIERSLSMILLAHIFYNYAVALRLLSGYWSNIAGQYEAAARTLGLSGWRLWWRLYLPLLRPALMASAILVFSFTFTSFGVVLVLGGIRFATLEVQIYYQTVSLFNLPLASALSLVQMLMMLMSLSLYSRWQGAGVLQLQASHSTLKPIQSWRERLMVSGVSFAMVFGLISPLVALVWRSLQTRQGINFSYYLQLFNPERQDVLLVAPSRAIVNSLGFAVLTVALALVLGTLAAYALKTQRWRGLEVVLMLPLVTSAVTLGLGFTLALDTPPLNLRGSWLIIPLAHTLVAMPFVTRSVLPALRAVPSNLLGAGATLGAGAWTRWWRIEFPLTRRALSVGALFAFTMSMGEFGASSFVARPDTPTIPVIIFRLLGQPAPASYGQALALSVVLLVICALSFWLIERLREVGVGEF